MNENVMKLNTTFWPYDLFDDAFAKSDAKQCFNKTQENTHGIYFAIRE